MSPRPSRPTVATIARDLGISAATVSYALNGKPGVSAAMRERVLEHARAVGWTPHSGAQALRRGRSGNIGLVLVRDPEEISREPFYSAVTAGIESAVSAHGSELLIRFVHGGIEEEVEVFRTWAHRRRVDGVVLLDMAQDDPRPPALAALDLPFAVLGTYAGPESFVNVLNAEGDDARTVLDHVQEAGYDGVIQLSGPLSFGHEVRRLDLIRRLCRERELPHTSATGSYSIEAGADGLLSVPAGISARPAVLASSDLIAVGALRAAQAQEIDVPGELGIISWDDSLIAEVATPAVTALSRRPFEMGRQAGDLLVRQIEGLAPVGTVLQLDPSALVQRASTAIP